MRALHPPIEPYRTGRLAVSDGHELHFEESGNPRGKPVVVLHGGPGAGSEPGERRFFDPARYRIVLYDQRGCGRSTPAGSLDANTTWDLVGDLERLRARLGIERWQVFGGSWGATLALAYAGAHPGRTSELVLRGVWLLREREIEWFYQGGASALFPDAWEDFVAPIPEAERGDLVRAYHRRLVGRDDEARRRAARAWTAWEAATCTLRPDPALVARLTDDARCVPLARIECHFVAHRAWLSGRDLLAGVDRIRPIPAVVVHGRHDVVCPLASAWALHRAWPEADLRIVPDAGHSAFEPGIAHELLEATDRFAALGSAS